jgi:XTP/dITP diphosphohydrolase
MKVTLISGNADKLRQARAVFHDTPIALVAIAHDRQEIQGESALEIARETALAYAKRIDGYVLREDHALYLHALQPFPGPYTHFFNKHMPVTTLLQAMAHAEDRSGFFELATVLVTPEGEVREYIQRVEIEVARTARGGNGNWDRVLMLRGESLTFAEKSGQSQASGGEGANPWNRNFRRVRDDLLSMDEDSETQRRQL